MVKANQQLFQIQRNEYFVFKALIILFLRGEGMFNSVAELTATRNLEAVAKMPLKPFQNLR